MTGCAGHLSRIQGELLRHLHGRHHVDRMGKQRVDRVTVTAIAAAPGLSTDRGGREYRPQQCETYQSSHNHPLPNRVGKALRYPLGPHSQFEATPPGVPVTHPPRARGAGRGMRSRPLRFECPLQDLHPDPPDAIVPILAFPVKRGYRAIPKMALGRSVHRARKRTGARPPRRLPPRATVVYSVGASGLCTGDPWR
jgi:hypothetical protein